MAPRNWRIPVSRPCLGPREQYLLNQTIQNNQLTHGEMVERFEQELARYLGVPYVVACSSGTTALHLALVALGVGPGHEVMVPDLSFVATANAVAYTGAKPVLVDIDPRTWCLDPQRAWDAESRQTRAVVPVHLYGRPAPMARLHMCANVVEDAAEALGGSFDFRPLGTHGRLGVFSFYGNKVLTTGEGGAIVAHRSEDAERLRLLRGQGMDGSRRYYHSIVGFNYRMTEMQAAIGLGQLSHVDDLLARRRAVCEKYHSILQEFDTSYDPNGGPWLFTIRLPRGVKRDLVAESLAQQGVETRPVFVPMHRLPMYAQPDMWFPHATDLSLQGLSLPTFPDLPLSDVEEIAYAVRKFAR